MKYLNFLIHLPIYFTLIPPSLPFRKGGATSFKIKVMKSPPF